MSASSAQPSRGGAPALHLYGWRHPSVLAAAVFSAYAGFVQFAATAALPDIAAAFGVAGDGAGDIAAEVGLSGTTLGIALGIIRMASVGSLPLARQADSHGRRRVMLITSLAALGLTAVAAGIPSFWLFVAVLAVARPLASATNAVAGVIAAEEVPTSDRSKALAVITLGYGVGAGLPVVLRAVTDLVGDVIGFRVLFALAGLFLATLPLVARLVREPDRAARLVDAEAETAKRLGHVPAALRGRLLLVATLTFFVAFLTGPINTYLFLYAESVTGLSPSIQGVVAPVAAGMGALGLLLGVRLADRYGRIPTAMWSKVALAAAGILTYSAGQVGAVAGYVLTLLIGSSYAPAVAATASEIFPTSIRATAAGWITVAGTVGAVLGLLIFGVVADAAGSFTTAAWVVCVPAAISTIGYRYLPETKHLELEQSAPEIG
ncbi:MFS transporter [Euzebya sp.]|uniref:MFS transporter n=1 Tax=Euzebya sp. TaxID=1971409 RepID=UPI003512297D